MKNKLIKSVILASSLLVSIGICGVLKVGNASAADVPNYIHSRISKQVNHMSYRQRIAQLFVVEVGNNTSANNRYIRKYHPGGILLKGNNFTASRANDRYQVKNMQKASGHNLLIGTDVEGGEVNRLSTISPYPHYLSPSNEYSRHGLSGIRSEYNAIGKNMDNLGLNWDYAPDADPSNGYMSFRTVKRGPYITAKYVHNAVQGLQNHKVAATVKHYPGYRGNQDTDYYPTYSNINHKTYQNDLVPFKKNGNSDSIMTNSVIYKRIARSPANLSRNIIMPLRDHYNGVIITDSLNTGAIRHYLRHRHGSADYYSLKAGNTMVMNSDLSSKLSGLVNDMHKGYLSKELIDTDVGRVLTLKYKLGLKY